MSNKKKYNRLNSRTNNTEVNVEEVKGTVKVEAVVNQKSKVGEVLTNILDAWNNLSEEEKATIKENVISGTKEVVELKKQGKLTGQVILNYILGIGMAVALFVGSYNQVTIEDVNSIVDTKMVIVGDSLQSSLNEYIEQDTLVTVIDGNVYLMGPKEAEKLAKKHGK